MRDKIIKQKSDPKDTPLKTDIGDLYSFLDILPIPAAMLDAMYNAEGEIYDFIFTYLNTPALQSLNSSSENLVGESFSNSSFHTGQTDILEKLKNVFTQGVSFKEDKSSSRGVNAVRFDHKILIQWNEVNQTRDQAKTISLLQNSNKELEQFAYIASHDLQEPIRMVMSFTQLLQRRYADKLDDEANEFIYYAVDGARRMKELIDKLLEYSRVGTEKRKWKKISVSTILHNIIEDYDVKLEETGININYGEMPVVISDESLLTRIFTNLISNAIKYRNENNPEINISAGENNHEWIFSITDNGIGIEKEHFEKIFLMFQRLHGKTKYPGMGMGLAICKRIVDSLGGRIWLESGIDKGSTFYFTIPKEGV